jgi:hypothetical protein
MLAVRRARYGCETIHILLIRCCTVVKVSNGTLMYVHKCNQHLNSLQMLAV